jgi:hypothetical protein
MLYGDAMRRRASTTLRSGAWAAGALLVAACGVSPQPEPPVHDPPTIDVARVSLGDDGAGLVLSGSEGAVLPGGSELRALHLDSAVPEVAVLVRADGSFEAAVSGAREHTFRLQAFLGELRSSPVDVTGVVSVVPDDGVVPVEAPLGDCLELDPPLELGPLAAGADAELQITNGCSSDVALSDLRLRQGSPAWTVAPGAPVTVPAGEARGFTVTFAPGPGDPLDDVLLVEIGAPVTGRRPITLRGRAP